MQLVQDPTQPSENALRYVEPEQAQRFEARREALLGKIAELGSQSFGASKPHCGPLSPGCQRCGQGAWSCLFLNQICNAKCFFCPWVMDMKETPPHAERVVFREAEQYAEYVARLGFRGVSFSGGEPFLTTDLLVEFVEALRRRVGSELHIWVYTNGLPATVDRLKRAVAAGVNEVRFNISDHDYTLDHVARAVGVVPRVTIEVPAVPEHAEQLRALLPAMQELGVNHLNLHQLMLTGQNGVEMMGRDYTYQRYPTPVVIESELSALETIVHALDNGIGLPINYCNIVYKDRWQNRVDHLRTHSLLARGWESQAKAGWLRRSWVLGDPTELAQLAGRLTESGEDAGRWSLMADEGRLYLHTDLLVHVDPGPTVQVSYHRGVMGEEEQSDWARDMADYHTIEIGPAKRIGVRLVPLGHPIPLASGDLAALVEGQVPEALAVFEHMPEGPLSYL